jgi:O-antigen/teichoic acid export membrane protein
MASLKRNTLMGAASSVVALGSTLIMNGITSRLLSRSEFGIAQFDIWVIQVIWTVANLGIPNALIRYISQYIGGPAEAFRRILRVLLLGASIGVVLGLGVILLVTQKMPSLDRCLMVGVFTTFGAQVLLQSIHAGRQSYVHVLIGSCVYAFVCLIGIFPAVRIGGVIGYLGLNTVAQFASVGAMVLPLIRNRFIKTVEGQLQIEVSGESLQSVVMYTMQTWLALVISAFVWQRMELYFINRYHTKDVVALYVAALTVGTLLTQPIALLSSALLPRFSSDFARGDWDSIERIYQESTLMLAALVFFICAMGTVHASLLTSTLFGQAYTASAPYVSVLIWGVGFGVVATPGSALIYGAGRSVYLLISGCFGLLCMLAIGYLLVAQVSLIWGAIGKSLLQILLICLGMGYISRFMGFHPPFMRLLRIGIATACSGLLGVLSHHYLRVAGTVPQIAIALGSTTLIFVGYAFALHLLRVFPQGGVLYVGLARLRNNRI